MRELAVSICELAVSICELPRLRQWYHYRELPVSCCVLMVRSVRNIHPPCFYGIYTDLHEIILGITYDTVILFAKVVPNQTNPSRNICQSVV